MYSGYCYCCNGHQEDLKLTLEEDVPKPEPLKINLKKREGGWKIV